MLAAVTQAPGVMVIDQVPEPGPPGPQDVIVRPEIVGICGSDLHVYAGDTGALSGARSRAREAIECVANSPAGAVKVLVTV